MALARYIKFFGCGLALADIVQTFRLGEGIQQFILARLCLCLFILVRFTGLISRWRLPVLRLVQ